MPTKYSVKPYIENGTYHIFNRGVEKRDIFIDDRDYKTFLYFLKVYLTDPEGLNPSEGLTLKGLTKRNFVDEINLLAHSLMPNHFHLLIHQKNPISMSEFMRCLATNYAMYFNKRYERVGSLFQGVFKAILIEKDEYLLHLSRYIHLNPKEINKNPLNYNYSSYLDYLGKRNTKWVKPKFILEFFKSQQKTSLKDILSYQSFVEDYEIDSKDILGKYAIE